MKKTILVAIAILTMCGSVQAQSAKVKYQGDVQLGFSAGIGTFALDRVNVHMINGVRINKYVSTGIGLGLDCLMPYNFSYNLPELTMPIFINAKGYLPVSPKTELFLSIDLGCSVGLTEGVKGMSGFMFTPAVGASFNVGNSKAITLSLGYNLQSWSSGGLLSVNADAITIKVGFKF